MAASSRECRLNDAESKRSADRPSKPRKRRNQLRRFQCRFCTNRFWFPRRLRAHEAAAHGVQFEAVPLKCGHCSLEFADKLALVLHQRSQHGKEVLNCSECLRSFINVDPSRLSPKGSLAILTECPTISGEPPTMGTLKKSSNRSKKRKTADCSVVESENPIGRCRMAMRPCQTAASVAGQLRLLCHFCEQDFLDSAQRERHELEAHGEFCVPPVFACSVCNVGFLQQHLLVDHLRKHDGILAVSKLRSVRQKSLKSQSSVLSVVAFSSTKRNGKSTPVGRLVSSSVSLSQWQPRLRGTYGKCFFCQLAFANAQGRNEHERDDHVTRGRMFSCNVCKLLSKSRPSFQQHYENCTPTFICPFCSMVFVNQKSLMRHSEKHFHNEFSCPHCTFTLATKRALDQHVHFHGQLITAGIGECGVGRSVFDGCGVCHVCGQVLRSAAAVRGHVARKHPRVTAVPTWAPIKRRTTWCRFCRQSFSDDRLRQAHIKEVHRTCEKCGICFAQVCKKRRHACPMQGEVLEAAAMLEENTLPCAIKTEVDSDCNDGEVDANESAPKEEEKTPPKRGRGRPRKTSLSKSEQKEKQFRSTAKHAWTPVASSAIGGSQHTETRQSNTCRICKKSFRSTRLRKVHEKSHLPENVGSSKSSTYPGGVTISGRNHAPKCAQCGALFRKRHALEEHLQLYCMRKQELCHDDSLSDDGVRPDQSPSLDSLPTNAAPSSSASPSTAISGITKEEVDDEAVLASPNPRPTAPRSPKEVNTAASNVRTSSGILRLLYSIEIPSDHAMPQPRQSTIRAGSRLPMLKCRFCTLRFATEYTRRKHETSEHQQKHPETPTESSNSAGLLPSSMDSLAPFQCKICQWPSYTSLKAVEHYESVHFAQAVSCAGSSTASTGSSSSKVGRKPLTPDLYDILGPKEYKAKCCGRILSRRCDVRRHICEFGPAMLEAGHVANDLAQSSSRRLLTNVGSFGQSGDQPRRSLNPWCETCGEVFGSLSRLSAHKLEVHSQTTANSHGLKRKDPSKLASARKRSVKPQVSSAPGAANHRSPAVNIDDPIDALTAKITAEMEMESANVDTKDLCSRIAYELKAHSIPQVVFAERILGCTQGRLSELLRNPKPWAQLKSGRETFRRMWCWLKQPLPQRLAILELWKNAGKVSTSQLILSS